jgi:hypothetical protein
MNASEHIKLDDIAPCGTRLHELLRFKLGELSGADKDRIQEHIEQCATCKARVAEIDAENARFLSEVNVASESANVLERLEQPIDRPLVGAAVRSFLDWSMKSPPRPLAIALFAVLLAVLPARLLLTPHEPTTREKGSAGVALEMYVNDPAHGAQPAADGATMHAGDQIQFRYHAAGKRYVMVVSLTEQGEISPLYPDAPGSSIAVAPNGTHVLEGSVILDEARGNERIFALFSDRPLSYDDVRSAISKHTGKETDVTRLRALDVEREDVDEATVLIHKE